jgi:hypothetical protein
VAISINWGTKVINIPRADMTLIQSSPTEIRQLNLDSFRLILKDLEDSEDGMAFEKTHKHNTSVTVGGVTLARVIEIVNGYTVTFEDGQYAVNLVGANSNVGDIVNVNQVSVRSANSAGLQDLSVILSAAYNGEVCVDVNNGQAGTDVPIGTRTQPVNNFDDARTIAIKEGARTIRILDSCTLANTDFSDGFVFTSDNPGTTVITVNPSADVQFCEFNNVSVQGTADGNNIYRNCVILDVDFTSGFIFQCSLNGTIQINGGELLALLSCFSNRLAGTQQPIIDFNGNGQLILRDYQGAIELRNHTDNSGDGDLCLDFSSGVCIIHSSVTAGYIPVRGVCRVVDNSTGTANVIDETVNNLVSTNASSLGVINTGVQKASKLIPHNTDI